MPHHIRIAEYDYELPDERIARFPLDERDASKLLLYKDGQIREKSFKQLAEELPPDSLLVFNNTRVIHARLFFTMPNGRKLEILCLEPLAPHDYQQNLSSRQAVRWKCMVGGNRRWKSGQIGTTVSTHKGAVQLRAIREQWLDGPFEIRFEWDDERLSFGEILAAGGHIPLPPYLGRDSEISDVDRYQTIYAQPEGSVAAPTAGLHFTDAVFNALQKKGIAQGFVTLHVGAGTFQPVNSEELGGHEMHRENIIVERNLLETLHHKLQVGAAVLAIGTTSMRTVESLYWLGVAAYHDKKIPDHLLQWTPYEYAPEQLPPPQQAISALLEAMDRDGQFYLEAYTQLLVAPGYEARIVDGIVTNFHQPRSTLLLLIAALVGEDWKKIYAYAMEHNFRFLSYGDSSLLWKKNLP